MEPSPYIAPPPPPPTGTALGRACIALFRQHRLPGVVEQAVDWLAAAVGLRYKTVRTCGLAVTLRRNTDDVLYVRSILEGQDYNPPGYDIGPEDTVVDVGGNIGSFALLAAMKAARGRVVTVEPVQENFDLLQRNINQNNFSNVNPIRAAVTDAPGTIRIYLNAGGSGYHSIHAYRGTSPHIYEDAPAVTLPGLFDQLGIERCHFLKLDCEGAEFPILRSLPLETFARIEKIAMEWHASSMATKRDEGDELVALLERGGYHIDAYIDFVKFRGGMIRARRIN